VNLCISIIDTGIGISPEGIQNLFIDFSKLQENSNRNKGGTGLGLSICKKIIEQMGGKVEVESTLGVGTSFNISLKTKCIVQKTKFANPETIIERDKPLMFIDKNATTEELEPMIEINNSL